MLEGSIEKKWPLPDADPCCSIRQSRRWHGRGVKDSIQQEKADEVLKSNAQGLVGAIQVVDRLITSTGLLEKLRWRKHSRGEVYQVGFVNP